MMALDLQKEMLDSLAASRPHDLQFAADLNKIYEEVEEEETEENESQRLSAERRVMRVVQKHGERIGHGDLLTSTGLNKRTSFYQRCWQYFDLVLHNTIGWHKFHA